HDVQRHGAQATLGRKGRQAGRRDSHVDSRRDAGLYDEPGGPGESRPDRPLGGPGSGPEHGGSQNGSQRHRRFATRDSVMQRALGVLVGALALVAVAAPCLLAADAPAGGISPWPVTGPFARGSGFYLSWWKLLSMWLIFLCWVRTTDWVSQDAQDQKVSWTRW